MISPSENLRARADDAPDYRRPFVADLTCAESVLMYEALRCIRDGRPVVLGNVNGDEAIVTVRRDSPAAMTDEQKEQCFTAYLCAYAKVRGGYDVPMTTCPVSPICAALATSDACSGSEPRSKTDLLDAIERMG